MKIISGTKYNKKYDISHIISIDIGFSNKMSSCGIAAYNNDKQYLCKDLTYGKLINELRLHLSELDGNIALIIEAPLSCIFDEFNNPTGRSFEKSGRKVRYWYTGPGAITSLAAMKLVSEIMDIQNSYGRIILYEGFVSFKENKPEHHYDDAIYLYNLFKNNHICDPDKGATSIFKSFGIPLSIQPPAIVISRCEHGQS